MATPIDHEFFARLNALNDKFAAGIPATLARLSEGRARLNVQAPERALIEELKQILHTIAGSAATFGFRILGREARNLEQRLRVMMAFESVGAADWNDWLLALDEYIAWGLRNPKSGDYPGTL